MQGATPLQLKTEQGQGGVREADRQFTLQMQVGTIWGETNTSMLLTSHGNKGSLPIGYHSDTEKQVVNGHC